MKVGDLVIRMVRLPHQNNMDISAQISRDSLGPAIVLAKKMMGSPEHPCVEVYYPKKGIRTTIAESLVEVIS
jgi:hypothetical protein